ncbi:galactokinase [Spirochaeta dissipatitropha]
MIPGSARTITDWKKDIHSGTLDSRLQSLYGSDQLEKQRSRWLSVLDIHEARGCKGPVYMYSAPGRTELGGNHTDHNNGIALAAAVTLDSIAVIEPLPGDDQLSVFSIDFDQEYLVSCSSLQVRDSDKGSLTGILRGLLAWCAEKDIALKAFRATLQSNVSPGSGLSSSACVESLFATVITDLGRESAMAGSRAADHAEGRIQVIDPIQIALCGQFAENKYFGKPSGLLDQIGTACGGVVGIDFADPDNVALTPLDFDFSAHGFQLCIVHTPSDHSADVDSYASIPAEMRQIASWFGANTLREVSEDDFWKGFARLRSEFSGRAIARAGHYFAENRRVQGMLTALKADDFMQYLKLVAESGHSSFQYLQNVIDEIDNQDYGLALLLIEARFGEYGVVGRVHGGGFGGTVQAYVPHEHMQIFIDQMERALGDGCVVALEIRSEGVVRI